MLQLNTRHFRQRCDGTTRRDFLRIGGLSIGGLGLGGLGLPGLLRARAAERAAGGRTKDTSVVLLFLSGGPSHIDTFDPKPLAPSEFRGPYAPIQTTVSGLAVSELMPKQARIMDRMSVVRTFGHADGNHGSAVHWVATGVLFPPADLGEPQVAPSPGSVAAKVRGINRQTGMPPYIALNRMPTGDGPAYLGVGCAPWEAKSAGKDNLTLPLDVPLDRVGDRRAVLAALDRLKREMDVTGAMSGLDEFQRQAFELVLGGRAQAAFDLSREDPQVVSRYGPDLGEQLLLARRLCEAGTAFVTIEWSGTGKRYGWDNHRGVFDFLSLNVPMLDHAVATFTDDVAQRGLSDRILLVVMGEMGRTPKINERAGRDHWPQVMFVLFSGGGLRMGQAVGQSSPRGEWPTSKPFGAQDLLATVYHVLGIDLELQFLNTSGRPMPIISSGRPIAELI